MNVRLYDQPSLQLEFFRINHEITLLVQLRDLSHCYGAHKKIHQSEFEHNIHMKLT
jgi:hypothetical protein